MPGISVALQTEFVTRQKLMTVIDSGGWKDVTLWWWHWQGQTVYNVALSHLADIRSAKYGHYQPRQWNDQYIPDHISVKKKTLMPFIIGSRENDEMRKEEMQQRSLARLKEGMLWFMLGALTHES